MNRAPPTTVGWAHAAEPAPGNAKAHFSFKRGTCSLEILAASAGWNFQPFVLSALQPFQRGCFHGSFHARGAGHTFFIEDAARDVEPPSSPEIPNDFPVSNSARACFSSASNLVALAAIAP